MLLPWTTETAFQRSEQKGDGKTRRSREELWAIQSPVPMGTGLLPRSLLTVQGACHSKTNLIRKDLDSEALGRGTS